jgi:malate dehydrogenase
VSSVILKGEYGVNGCAIGVPVVLGREGFERIVELKLSADEKKMFEKAVKGIKEMIAMVRI